MVAEVERGHLPGSFQGGIIQNSHSVRVVIERGEAVSAATDDALLDFIANWRPESRTAFGAVLNKIRGWLKV